VVEKDLRALQADLALVDHDEERIDQFLDSETKGLLQ